MARQMETQIRCNNLLTLFQSGFRRHHSTTAAVLKVTDTRQMIADTRQIFYFKKHAMKTVFDFLKIVPDTSLSPYCT
jgi:hypothetical protein